MKMRVFFASVACLLASCATESTPHQREQLAAACVQTELVQQSGVSHVRPETQQNDHPIVAFTYRYREEGITSDVRITFTGEFDEHGSAEYETNFAAGERPESDLIDLLDRRCRATMMIFMQD